MKRIKLLAIMMALTIQNLTVWAATTSDNPVDLTYRPAPMLGNNPKPSKAPARFRIPLSASFNDESQQLLMVALDDMEYTYNIYAEDGAVVAQGALNCNEGSYNTVDLSLLDGGEYCIVVTYNGHNFEGIFEVYE